MGYRTLQLYAKYATTSDYSDKVETAFPDYIATPTGFDYYRYNAITTAPTALNLAGYSAITLLVIQNADPANYVTVTFNTGIAGGATSVRLLAGQPLVIPDVQIAGDVTITANGGTCVCHVLISGTST